MALAVDGSGRILMAGGGAIQIGPNAPLVMWPGNIGLQSFAFAWTPPAGNLPDSYNVYRDGARVYTGVLRDPNAAYGNYPWVEDRGLANGSTHTWYVTAVSQGIESAPSPTVTATTLTPGATATPIPPASISWIPAFSLPTGTVWTCTNLSSTSVAGTSGPLNNVGCSFYYAINNYSPGDLIVLTAGATYPTDNSGNGYMFPNKPNPSNLWTYVISSETPGYTGGGQTLLAQSYNSALGGGVTDYNATGGNWVTYSNVPAIATIEIEASNGSAINLQPGANYLRFVGIWMRPPYGGTGPLTFASIGGSSAFPTGAGARNVVLSTPWAGATGGYNVTFSDGRAVSVVLTNGSTAFSWTAAALVNNVTASGTFEIQRFQYCYGVMMPFLPANGSILDYTPCESIMFDRCLVGMDPTTSFASSNSYTPMLNGSYVYSNHVCYQQCHFEGFSDVHQPSGSSPYYGYPTVESHGFLIMGGQNIAIRNCFIESVTEDIFCGGSYVSQNHPIQDITISNNFLWKNPFLFNTTSSYDFKNFIEMKAGVRANIHHNVCTNNAGGIVDPQNGRGMQFWANDQIHLNPWTACSDIDVHDNIIANCACPIYFSGSLGVASNPSNPWNVNCRMRFQNNMCFLSPVTTNANYLVNPYCTMLGFNVPDQTFDHNTFIINSSNTNWASSGNYLTGCFSAQSNGVGVYYLASDGYSPNGRQVYSDRVTFTNNIFSRGHAFTGTGLPGGTSTYTTIFPTSPNASANNGHNLFLNDTVNYTGTDFPNVGAITNVGFANYTDETTWPLPPAISNLNVTSLHNTSSTTGGPLGATF